MIPHLYRRGSTYFVPSDATGDDRIYGRFDDCAILGTPCAIEVESARDADPEIKDMLGVPCAFRRGAPAIHISGLDPFGVKTGPGFIRAIGRYRVDWLGREDHPSGLGCHGVEPAVIVSWDGDGSGRGHRDERWQHHVFWGGVSAFVTLAGVYDWWCTAWREDRPFTPRDVCERIDEVRGDDVLSCMRIAGDAQHERAVRRLLEVQAGVGRNAGIIGAVLERVGRWGYRFSQ